MKHPDIIGMGDEVRIKHNLAVATVRGVNRCAAGNTYLLTGYPWWFRETDIERTDDPDRVGVSVR